MSIIYKGLHILEELFDSRSDAPRVHTGQTTQSRTNHTTQNVAWRLFFAKVVFLRK